MSQSSNNGIPKKPEIEYPCCWSYKVVGSDKAFIQTTVAELFADRSHQFSESNQSKTGKYVSMELSLTVVSEEERVNIYNILCNLPSVRMVL